MMNVAWLPLYYPEVERRLLASQPDGFRFAPPNTTGWIGPIHSPLREDQHPSFSVRPDSPTDPGAWKDHATGEHGSMANLAGRLGVDPCKSVMRKPDTPRVPENTFDEFCRRRKLDKRQLSEKWRVTETTYRDRPALRFPTRVGVDRIKYLDGSRPKCEWVKSGGKAHWYGLGAATASANGSVYIVNGEPSVWACGQAGVPAVCMCSGEGAAPTDEMIATLKQEGIKSARVVYDLDEAGRKGAARVVERLKAAGFDAVSLELPAHLGHGGDVDDLHRVVGDDDLSARLAELPELEVVEVMSDWPERQPLPDDSPVPTLPPELLPESLRPWLEDIAGRAVLPLELPAVPAIIGLGAVVGRTVAIRPERRDDWTVVPNLWGGIVARPGLLKTHAIDSGLAPLAPLIKAADEQYVEEARTMTARRMVLDDRFKAARRQKGGASEATIASLLAEIEECHAVEQRYKTHDATVEKLGELLRDNPRGLLLYRDELGGWLRSFERHGREGEREFFLEAWNGSGGYVFDRIERGTIRIPALCLSVVGGIQPGKLACYVAGAVDGGQGADGLLQRLQVVVWPDRLAPWVEPTRWPDHEAKARAFKVYAALDAQDPRSVGADCENGTPHLKFTPEAQELFTAWRNELEQRLRGDTLLAFPAFESHLAKYRSLMPSLALLFHLVDVVAGSANTHVGVSLDAAQRAAAWCEFLELHARKVYSIELTPERTAARAIADRIKAGVVEHRATVRDLYRPHWGGLRRPEDVEAALDYLQQLGWLRVAEEGTGGRPRRVIELHPSLRKGGRDG